MIERPFKFFGNFLLFAARGNSRVECDIFANHHRQGVIGAIVCRSEYRIIRKMRRGRWFIRRTTKHIFADGLGPSNTSRRYFHYLVSLPNQTTGWNYPDEPLPSFPFSAYGCAASFADSRKFTAAPPDIAPKAYLYYPHKAYRTVRFAPPTFVEYSPVRHFSSVSSYVCGRMVPFSTISK